MNAVRSNDSVGSPSGRRHTIDKAYSRPAFVIVAKTLTTGRRVIMGEAHGQQSLDSRTEKEAASACPMPRRVRSLCRDICS